MQLSRFATRASSGGVAAALRRIHRATGLKYSVSLSNPTGVAATVVSRSRDSGVTSQYAEPSSSPGKLRYISVIHGPNADRNCACSVRVYGMYLAALADPLLFSNIRTGFVVRTPASPVLMRSTHGARSS